MKPAYRSFYGRWRCPFCRSASTSTRSFSSTHTSSEVGPESPRYVDIPEPPQASQRRKQRTKGFLPVPRDIFHRREGGVDKVTPEYLDAASKEPINAPPAKSSDSQASYRDLKQRMSAQRRQNFREGLTELQSRRRRDHRIQARRSARKQKEREEILNAPEPEHDRLTQQSITMLMSTSHRGSLPDPNREQRIAAKRARVEAKETQRASDRQQALHTLYMHARNFITNEDQLNHAIDEAFGTPQNPKVFKNNGQSIWSDGLPETLQDKLNGPRKRDGDLEDTNYIATLTSNRIKKIAEELTGGKM